MDQQLDEVDHGILYLLQQDARNTTAQEIANQVGVSPSTVRNRIDHLEDVGVIQGYHPEINYDAANLPLRVLFVITATPTERADMVERLLDIRAVIDVREMLTGRRNIYVEVVATSSKDLNRVTDAIHELGVNIESSEIVRERKTQPFNHFHFSE